MTGFRLPRTTESITLAEPQINSETGFYCGRGTYDALGNVESVDCFIVGLLNYLLVNDVHEEELEKIKKNWFTHGQFATPSKEGMIYVSQIPKTIENLLGSEKTNASIHLDPGLFREEAADAEKGVYILTKDFLATISNRTSHMALALNADDSGKGHMFVVIQDSDNPYALEEYIDSFGSKRSLAYSPWRQDGIVIVDGLDYLMKNS